MGDLTIKHSRHCFYNYKTLAKDMF